MNAHNIIVGQRITEEKVRAAKRLRAEMTDAERLLWDRLRRNQLCGAHFRRQQIIRGFIVDFYCHKSGLVIELDGDIHVCSKDADRERQAVIEGLGLKMIHFRNEEIFQNVELVLEKIAENLTPGPFPTREGE